MMKDYYKPLHKRVVTQTPDGGGGYSETTADTPISGFIGVLSGNEIIKNQAIGNTGTARFLTSESLAIKDRVVDTYGNFSVAGTVYEITWKYINQFEDNYYDLRVV
jgi:hypothetical protein